MFSEQQVTADAVDNQTAAHIKKFHFRVTETMKKTQAELKAVRNNNSLSVEQKEMRSMFPFLTYILHK